MAMHPRCVLATVLVGLLLPCSGSAAAELKLSIAYETSYLSDFSPAPYSLSECFLELAPSPDDIHQFSLYAELIGATDSPEQSLGGILLDIVLGHGLMASPSVPYSAVVSPSFDPLPLGPIGGGPRPLYSTNFDAGDQDLIRIALETDQLAAHGLDPGESGPALLGNFFVQWDLSAPGAALAALYAAPAASAPADPWALWEGTNAVVPPAAGLLSSDVVPMWKYCPEPSSLLLAGLALLGLTSMIRRH